MARSLLYVTICTYSTGYLLTDNVETQVKVKDKLVTIPRIPAKYLKFLRARRKIFREIEAMHALQAHPNVRYSCSICL